MLREESAASQGMLAAEKKHWICKEEDHKHGNVRLECNVPRCKMQDVLCCYMFSNSTFGTLAVGIPSTMIVSNWAMQKTHLSSSLRDESSNKSAHVGNSLINHAMGLYFYYIVMLCRNPCQGIPSDAYFMGLPCQASLRSTACQWYFEAERLVRGGVQHDETATICQYDGHPTIQQARQAPAPWPWNISESWGLPAVKRFCKQQAVQVQRFCHLRIPTFGLWSDSLGDASELGRQGALPTT